MDNKYSTHEEVYINGSSNKYNVHEVIQTASGNYTYRLWEKGTQNYALFDEYQLSKEATRIGFNTD